MSLLFPTWDEQVARQQRKVERKEQRYKEKPTERRASVLKENSRILLLLMTAQHEEEYARLKAKILERRHDQNS